MHLGENLNESIALGKAILPVIHQNASIVPGNGRIPKSWAWFYGDRPDISLFQ